MATRAKCATRMGMRRRSAYELRAASMASQILARYRRTSLHDGLMNRSCGPTPPQRSAIEPLNPEDHVRCSHRSSVSTAMDEDDQAPELIDDLDTAIVDEGEHRLSQEKEEDDDDMATPLPETTPPPRCHRQCSSRSHRLKSSATSSASQTTPAVVGLQSTVPRRRYGTMLRELPLNELYLFREEAEYSDYLNAIATGVHVEMDSVVFYEVEVHLSQSKWTVLRRFSEYRSLRKRLLKHLVKRQRLQGVTSASRCMICANIMQTIEQVPFPSRKQQRKPWFAALRSRAYNRKLATRNALVVADRKRKLHEFVSTCLTAVRGLRQHSRLMCDSSACEISVALRMIEEFLGLSFTRYMRFLAERGVVDAGDRPKGGKQRPPIAAHRAEMKTESVNGRRANVAV